jgi:mono/diheme cytochrome c family protein
MSLFLLKSIIAVFFLGAALVAALAMLTLMGKMERKSGPETLRKIHKRAGFVFGLLLLILSIVCIIYLGKAGDQISLRAVLHAYLALFLLVIFALKVTIVRFFRQFLKVVPTLGMTVLVLAVVIFLSSAGYFFLRSARSNPQPAAPPPTAAPSLGSAAEKGAQIFRSRCAACHFADKEDRKTGPGLKGILIRPRLPVSGRPATPENILKQLETPYLAMPAFPSLVGQDAADLLAYLKTL